MAANLKPLIKNCWRRAGCIPTLEVTLFYEKKHKKSNLTPLLASLRKPARCYGYRGLKIFTSLPLRFQDFQRQHVLG
jgi:hypothetical protein